MSVLQKNRTVSIYNKFSLPKFQFIMDRFLRTKRFLGYMDLRTTGILWGHINIIFIALSIWQYFKLSEEEKLRFYFHYDIYPETIFILYGNLSI